MSLPTNLPPRTFTPSPANWKSLRTATIQPDNSDSHREQAVCPDNSKVKAREDRASGHERVQIRQQPQVLRDKGLLIHTERGLRHLP